jgi:hypothetical protein
MVEKNYISKQCCDCKDPPESYIYKPFIGAITPKSLAAENCIDRGMYRCSNTRVTKVGRGPSSQDGKVMILNESFGLTEASDFFPDQLTTAMMTPDHKVINVVDPKCSETLCATYCDPRVRDARTGQLIKLDRPPYTGHVALENIYNNELRGYGKNYRSYQDIDAGQIQYYVPEEDREANQRPIYTLESNTVQTIREDPMGGLIPEYKREQISNGILNASRYQDTRDQLKYREDLMDGIRYQQNKTSYGVLWESVLERGVATGERRMSYKNYKA